MKIYGYIFILLISLPHICRSDQLFVGIAESDRFSDLEQSVDAFAEVTRLPSIKEMFRDKFKALTALPEIRGFEKDKRVRIIQTVDPQEPLSEINPACIAILPIRDGGEAIESMLSASYKNRTYWRSSIHVYETPGSTNLFPLIAAVQDGMYMLTSRSKSALLWACENKQLLSAAPLKQKGAIKLLINPQRLSAVLNAKADSRLLAFFKPAEILQELESCTVSLLLESQSITLTAQARPLEGSPMTGLIRNLTKPDTSLLDSAPESAFLQSVSRCNDPAIWNRFALNLQNYVVPALTRLNKSDLFTGERAQYLAPTPDAKGVYFVQIDTIKEAQTLKQSIAELDNDTRSENRIFLEKSEPEPGSDLLRYKVNVRKSEENQEEQSAFFTIASLFLQHAYLELQIVNDRLITVLGPKGSIREVLNAAAPNSSDISLLREIASRNDSIGRNLLSGSKVQPSAFLKHVASIIPHITREQLALLPDPGYGLTFSLGKPDDNRLDASLQISADEVAALSRIGNDSRELMQKLLVTMLIERIEKDKSTQPENTTQ